MTKCLEGSGMPAGSLPSGEVSKAPPLSPLPHRTLRHLSLSLPSGVHLSFCSSGKWGESSNELKFVLKREIYMRQYTIMEWIRTLKTLQRIKTKTERKTKQNHKWPNKWKNVVWENSSCLCIGIVQWETFHSVDYVEQDLTPSPSEQSFVSKIGERPKKCKTIAPDHPRLSWTRKEHPILSDTAVGKFPRSFTHMGVDRMGHPWRWPP